jgi:hypothetical protein
MHQVDGGSRTCAGVYGGYGVFVLRVVWGFRTGGGAAFWEAGCIEQHNGVGNRDKGGRGELHMLLLPIASLHNGNLYGMATESPQHRLSNSLEQLRLHGNSFGDMLSSAEAIGNMGRSFIWKVLVTAGSQVTLTHVQTWPM